MSRDKREALITGAVALFLMLVLGVLQAVYGQELHLTQRPHALMNSLMHSDTTTSTPLDDRLILGNGTAWEVKAVPNCGEAGTLNYSTATNAFSCLTDASGGGGGGNFVEASVDFGATEMGYATVAVAATWVTSTSTIVCGCAGIASADRDEYTCTLLGLEFAASARADGVGFTLQAFAPNTASGLHVAHCTGG